MIWSIQYSNNKHAIICEPKVKVTMKFMPDFSDLPENVLTNENEPPNCLYTLHKVHQITQ